VHRLNVLLEWPSQPHNIFEGTEQIQLVIGRAISGLRIA
jgi:hypothetical protein